MTTTLVVTCGDIGTEFTHKGRVEKVGTFERHGGRWYSAVPEGGVLTGRDQAARVTRVDSQGRRRLDTGPLIAGTPLDPDLLGRFDGLGDDIAGKHVESPCPRCRRNVRRGGDKLIPILDQLADAGVCEVSLAALSSTL